MGIVKGFLASSGNGSFLVVAFGLLRRLAGCRLRIGEIFAF